MVPPVAAIAPVLAPDIRFVVVSPMRAGSELLVSLLNSHPRIVCESEILRTRHPRLSPERYVDARSVMARVRHRRTLAFGFKLQAADLETMAMPTDESGRVDAGNTADARAVADELAARGWRFIALERRNLLHQAMSWWRAKNEALWNPRVG